MSEKPASEEVVSSKTDLFRTQVNKAFERPAIVTMVKSESEPGRLQAKVVDDEANSMAHQLTTAKSGDTIEGGHAEDGKLYADNLEDYRLLLTIAHNKFNTLTGSDNSRVAEKVQDILDHEVKHFERAKKDPGLTALYGMQVIMDEGRKNGGIRPFVELSGSSDIQTIKEIFAAPDELSASDRKTLGLKKE